MPFKVEQVMENNMSLIEWTISIKPPVKKTDNDTSMEESLQLFRYNSFVSCKFVCSLSLRYWKPGKNKAFLRLRWIGKPNGLETEDSPEFHHLPCNIAVCVDGKKRQPLKPVWVLENGSWKSDAHGLIISNNENGVRKIPVTFIFQIKLEPTFLRGEKTALKLLTDLFVHQVNCDVQFSFEGDCRIGGHSKILSASSQVFAALFQNKGAHPFVIENILPEIFKSLLNYIYCGRISMPLMTCDTAQKLYLAANKFKIEDLKEDCIDYLLVCLKQNNVNDLISWAEQHSVEKVKNAADAFKKLNCTINATQKVPSDKEVTVAPVNQETSNVQQHQIKTAPVTKKSVMAATQKVDCTIATSVKEDAVAPVTQETSNVQKLQIKTAPVTKKSVVAPNSSHPPYLIMVTEAINILNKKRKGCSRQAILNYIFSSFELGVDWKMANVHLKQALKRGVAQGVLLNTTGVKGAAGSFRLFDPKRDIHVPKNRTSEKAVPPAAKKAKLVTSTSLVKKTTAASTKKNPVTKNQMALKVLAAAKMVSLKADPGELPIKSAPIVKQEVVEAMIPLPTNQ